MGHQTKSHLKDKGYRIETRENEDFQVFRISSWQGNNVSEKTKRDLSYSACASLELYEDNLEITR